MIGRRLPGSRGDVVRVAAGVAGVVAAHALDYLAVYPDSSVRTQVLAATGHRYWSVAATAAVMGSAIAAVAAAVRGACRSGGDDRDLRSRFAALARFQVALFAAVEVVERIAAHVSPLTLLHGRPFALGLVLQLVVAAVVVAAMALVESLARRVRDAIGGGGGGRLRRPALAAPPVAMLLTTAPRWTVQQRGPPALAG